MHSLKDVQLIKTVALPAAGASAQTDSLDLLQGSDQEAHFEVELSLPALPSLADDKSVTVTLKDSEDDASFDAIAALAALVVTGAGGSGSAAASRKVRLPSDTRRYLRADVAVEAAGGDNTAKALTLALVF